MEYTQEETARPLRVAVCLDSLSAPAWIRAMLAEIQRIPGVEIVLLLLASPGASQAKPWKGGKAAAAYRLWNRFERAVVEVSPDALQKTDCEGLFSACERICVQDSGEQGESGLFQAAVDAVRRSGADVILQLGAVRLPEAISALPRLGVWSLQHGLREAAEEEIPGGWEVLRGAPVTYSTLRVRKGTETAILFASATATDCCSITRNRNRCYWKAAQFIPRKLRELASSTLPAWPLPGGKAGVFRDERGAASRGNLAALGGAVRVAWRTAVRHIPDRLIHRQWFCAFGFRQNAAGESQGFDGFQRMIPPRGRFWADPFPACMDGKYYVFFEEYDYAAERAHIAVSEVAADGSFSPPRVALQRPYHVSYPMVFSWNGEWYMIPESAAQRTIELWRCGGAADRWEFDRLLMDGVLAVDSTIAEIAGRFWLFTCIAADEHLPCDELSVFWADSPVGPWRPHPRNPVVSDARCARPAGKLFFREGKWFRPAQDCTGHYGRRIEIREIVRLTADDYCERPAWTIEPDWSPGLVATHTLNTADDLTVIDGCRRRYFNF
jgi:hypothetical protein